MKGIAVAPILFNLLSDQKKVSKSLIDLSSMELVHSENIKKSQNKSQEIFRDFLVYIEEKKGLLIHSRKSV
jgi:hypothetical protein